MNRLIIVLVLVLVALFALPRLHHQVPVVVQSQSWTVLAGADAEDGAMQALRFLPEGITIHVGDSVTWQLNAKEEHTIYFTAGGSDPMFEVVGPDGRHYANPAVFFASSAQPYDGNGPFGGGVLEADRKTFTLTFTKPGAYEYHCEFHPGMKGKITVLPADQPLPKTQADYEQIAQAEAAQALDAAKNLERQMSQPAVNSRPDGTQEYVLEMLGDSKTMATVLRFLPSSLHIRVGDTVTWRMPDYTELHTVTFLDRGQKEPDVATAEPQPNGPPKLLINAQVEKPAGGKIYEGQGYFNSGYMMRLEGQPPATYSLTFTKPGTYEYRCLIHDEFGMKATIVVEPNVQQAIADSNSRFMTAFDQGDIASIAAHYADDAKLLPPNNPMVQGRQQIQDFFKSLLAMSASRALVLKTLEVNGSADLAYEVGTYTLTLQPQSASQSITDTGKYVTIWKRQADGSLKLAIDIWNSDLPATPAQRGAATTLQPAVADVKDLAARSQELEEGVYETSVASLPSGQVAWDRLEKVDFPMHYHGQNEVAYVLQGQFILKAIDGSSATVGPGQLVVIPAGVAHALSGSGDALFFATPPENEKDTVWLEGPRAKPGAKADPTKKPEVIDVAQRIGRGLDQKGEGFNLTFAYKAETGSVEFVRVDQAVALHQHPQENHVLYILKGHGRGQIGGQTAEIGPGQIIVIPAGVAHKLERIGDEPLDLILFSMPPFNLNDIVWLK